MALYKYVLHHSGNAVPKWFLEVLGVWVSLLNRCAYCVEHHFAGLSRLLADDRRAGAMRAALEAGETGADVFSPPQQAALVYARALTADPGGMIEDMVADLRAAGWSDGEILEINQVTAYFAFANRTVLGLGVSIDGEVLGLSPNDSDDPGNWSHS